MTNIQFVTLCLKTRYCPRLVLTFVHRKAKLKEMQTSGYNTGLSLPSYMHGFYEKTSNISLGCSGQDLVLSLLWPSLEENLQIHVVQQGYYHHPQGVLELWGRGGSQPSYICWEWDVIMGQRYKESHTKNYPPPGTIFARLARHLLGEGKNCNYLSREPFM